MKRVLVVAGGTGGHIFPALAVANILKDQSYSVSWLGARYGLENQLVPTCFPMETIAIQGMRRRGVLAKLLTPWRMLRAMHAVWRVMKVQKPDLVLAMGGYVAAPGGLVAWLRKVPLVIHEQNARAGLTNRLLAKFARVRLQAFSNAFAGPAKTIGNPVRSSLLQIDPPETRYANRTDELRILVIGGSQGARALNQCMMALCRDFSTTRKINIWHQTGELDFAEVSESYAKLPLDVKVQAFINDVDQAYAWADVVICRAGAMTVSEVAAVGVASILIPYPQAVDNHQWYNARYLSEKNAAVLLPQSELSPEKLRILLQGFISDKQSLLKMAQSARKLACRDAAQAAAQVCIQCIDSSIQ